MSAPDQVPGYQILGELGRGGMGVVYQARQVGLNRLVALKMILAAGHAGPDEIARFRREAQAVARLRHPHVVQIYEVGEVAGRPYFSLEFVEGGSLAQRLDGTPWEPAAAARLVETLARALHAAHRTGVIHRDLKPGNVLLTLDGVPKVTDFGLAKQLDQQEHQTASGAILGTPSYMPPEQAAHRKGNIGPAADIYALGAVLYELLTGRPPFKAATPLDTVLQVLGQEPVPPTRLQPKTPRDLETICLKCLEKDARRRYESADALAEDLRRFQSGEPIRARPVPWWEQTLKWTRRHPARAALMAVVALAVLGLATATVMLSRAIRRERAASAEATRQREEMERQKDRADGNLRRAQQAVEDYCTSVASDERLRQADLYGLRKELLTTALPFYQEFLKQRAVDPKLRAAQGKAYAQLARLQTELGERAAALADYQQMEKVFEELAQGDPAEPSYRIQLARGYSGRAQLLQEQGQRGEAESLCRKALALDQELLAQHPQQGEYRREFARSAHCLATLLEARGQYGEAERAYRQAIDLLRPFATAAARSAEDRAELAEVYQDFSKMLSKTMRPEEAEAAQRQEIALAEALMKEFPRVPDYRDQLAKGYNNLAALLGRAGRIQETDAALHRVLDLVTQLAKDFPHLPKYRRALALAYNNLGSELADHGRAAEAAPFFRQAIELEEELAAQAPQVAPYRYALAQMYFTEGGALRGQGHVAESEASFRKALALSERLSQEHPSDPTYTLLFADTATNLGLLFRDSSTPQAALPWYPKALAALERVLARTPHDPQALLSMREAYWARAMTLSKLARYADAARDWQQTLAWQEKLLKGRPDDLANRLVEAALHLNLAALLRDHGDAAKALEHAVKSADLLQRIPERAPQSAEAHRILRESYEVRAVSLTRLHRDLEAANAWAHAARWAGKDKPWAAMERAISLARAGRHEEAVAQALKLSREHSDSPWLLYHAGRACAVSASVAKDPARAQRYADLAVELLRKSCDHDLMRLAAEAHIDPANEPDFSVLRQRKDFRQLWNRRRGAI